PAQAAIMLEKTAADPQCRLALGKALFLAGDPRGALRALEDHAGGSNAGDSESSTLRHLYRGRALEALGEHETAVDELRLYFEQFPDVPRPAETSIEAATDLARAYTALNRQAEAVAQYRMIAGLADSLALWNRKQSVQALEKKDLSGAVVSLQAVLRWNRQDNVSRRLLARALNDLGRHPEALVVWRELDEMLHGDSEALRNIAGLSLEIRRPQDAVAAFRRLREIEDDPDIIERLDAEIRRLESTGQPGIPTVDLRF
ncbi:MAG TPA: tetratricopeptide repeat protein, partial [Patescibacteria group bacterium]|nr:tetratricopeptide repeat protein [Patescibacteria group bacterium]